MHTKIEKRWRRMEHRRNILLGLIDDCTEEQRQWRPAEGEWNMVEVCLHLIGSEGGILKFMIKKNSKSSTQKSNWKSHIRSFLLNRRLRSPDRLKAPKVPGLTPEDTEPYAPTREKWEKLRGEWKTYLEEFPDAKFSYYVMKHPLAGKLTMTQTLSFIETHILHHTYQVQRLLGHKDFPGQE